MKRKALKMLPLCPVPEDPAGVVLVSQTAVVEGKTVLDIDIYQDGRLRARYFADRKGHMTEKDDRWSVESITSTVRQL